MSALKAQIKPNQKRSDSQRELGKGRPDEAGNQKEEAEQRGETARSFGGKGGSERR
ncbi:hypothetical protein HMPREF1986_01318 [Oribacterium sp. oral taxon 078 str. F0263]|nr:hypothetical protein HMPREF1986_01318 [Oribacterium sp. oral taxon 078 str. F0263]